MGGRLTMKPDPFAYPSAPYVRRHGPYGYKKYEYYREWLRDEFSFRCVFCLYREQWPSTQTWEIDHLLPKSKYAEKKTEYDNLLYVCRSCNANKAAKLVPDPCRIALGKCLQVHPDGNISALNAEGRLLIAALRLNNVEYRKMRKLVLDILESLFRNDRKQFLALMCYPQNLPDFANLKPLPIGNTKMDGLKNSFYELRARGELPEVY